MLGYLNRTSAGRKLALELSAYRDRKDVIVLALPRGGVPVGVEVARFLHVPLDLLLVRKLGFPSQPELAMGAIAGDGTCVLNQNVVSSLYIPDEVIRAVVEREQLELGRREQLYREGRPFPEVRGRTIIVVDDGIATGASIRAAIQVLRNQGAERIVVAVPVAAPSAVADLSRLADEVVCPLRPESFQAIGEWYEDFAQVDDRGVIELLKQNIMDAQNASAS